MRAIRLTTLVTLFLSQSGSMLAFGAASDVPKAGQQAPDVTLPSQDGSQVSLKDFRGKWVVLYFYPKDNTPGCTIEAHNFQRDLSKYDQLNAVIIGVSVDSTDSHKDFCAKQSLTFKLLADTDKKVAGQYGSLRESGVAARNRCGPESVPRIIATRYWPCSRKLKRASRTRFLVPLDHRSILLETNGLLEKRKGDYGG